MNKKIIKSNLTEVLILIQLFKKMKTTTMKLNNLK